MALSINQKQNYLYFIMVILTILLAGVSYRMTQKKWLLYREAQRQFDEKDYKEAILFYTKSLEEGNTRGTILSRIGDSYTALGNFPEAIKWYRLYLESYPDDVNVRLSFARVLSWNGNIQEGEEEYQKVLEIEHEMD